jgi:SPP1 family predicted phage head-tail adaptor
MTGAGDLDRRVIVERYATQLNDFNEPELVWSPAYTLWASYSAVSDAEKLSAGQINSSLSARFVIRSSAASRTIDSKDRLRFDGAEWEITGVKETKDGRKQFIEISATRQSD